MSGATTELNLATAVDADDNADYLTISLANSLRTVDGLFNNITGHTHGGAHQGGPVAPAAGSIPGTALTNGTVTNAKLASDTARANLLTNGGFEIWQRGNGPFTTAGLIGPDRWILSAQGTDTLSVSRDTTNIDTGSVACAACTFTLGTGAGGTYVDQLIKPSENQILGRTLSFSVRVRTSPANAIRVAILVDGTGGTTTYSTYHPGGGTYQTLTVTAPVPSNATYCYVIVYFAASCTAYIDNAMLVVGSVPADYAPLHPADDLARCLRYYETSGVRNAGYAVAASQLEWWTSFKAVKPVTPTITLSAQANTNIGTITSAFAGPTGTDLYGPITANGVGLMNLTYTAESNP